MEEGGIREFAKAAAAAVAAAQGGAPPPERKYRGVRRKQGCNMYSVEMRDPSGDRSCRKLWLGNYDTAVEAACVYDAAVRTLRPHGGANAKTNFPEQEKAATEEEKANRAAVVLAYVDELKCKRVVAEAAKAAAVVDAGSSAVAPPPPAPAAPEGEASSSQTAAATEEDATATAGKKAQGDASSKRSLAVADNSMRKKIKAQQPSAFQPPPLAAAATPAFPTRTNRPSAFRPYRATGGCTMANISPAHFQHLYRRFVESLLTPGTQD